jgi:hypothetical protein
MKKPVVILLMVVVACFLIFGFAVSQEEQGKAETDTVKKEEAAGEKTAAADSTKADSTKVVFKYIGNTKCKMCHNSPKKGAIHDIWAKTKHATAYATLASEESKKIAKEKGIKDAQQDAKCLICHVSGYGQPNSDKYSVEEGVGCEACHGPGEKYWPIKVMSDKKVAMENGLVEPTEELCVSCHNEKSPTYKPFVFKDAYKLVEHHAPKAEK